MTDYNIIYIANNGSSSGMMQELNRTGDSREQSIGGLSSSTSYTFLVRSINSIGISPFSNPVVVVTPLQTGK